MTIFHYALKRKVKVFDVSANVKLIYIYTGLRTVCRQHILLKKHVTLEYWYSKHVPLEHVQGVLMNVPIGEEMTVDGYTIPANTNVILMNFALHRDPTLFTNPDQFNPDR